VCAICAATLHPLIRHAPGIPATWSCVSYHNPIIKRLFREWKYRGNRHAEEILIPLFLEGCKQMNLSHHDVLVPVPTQRSHNNQRGFAPPQTLAFLLQQHYGCPTQDILHYARPVKRQASLGLAKRKENMHNALVVRKGTTIVPRSAILIDDVVTSGATLAAAAHALTQHGARDIRAITLAWNP